MTDEVRKLQPPTLEKRLRGRILQGAHSEVTLIGHRLQRHAQVAMVVISQRNEAERLQSPVGRLARGREHLRHANDGADLGLKADLDEVPLAEWLSQFKESAGCRDGEEFASRALAIIESDRSQHRTA